MKAQGRTKMATNGAALGVVLAAFAPPVLAGGTWSFDVPASYTVSIVDEGNPSGVLAPNSPPMQGDLGGGISHSDVTDVNISTLAVP